MHENSQLIARFYEAFKKLDYSGMQTCYHPHAFFYDPVFQDLNAYEVKKMWEMLCKNAKDFSLVFSDLQADEEYGQCKWTATYLFTATGKKVVNKITAYFKFHEGQIIEHTDDFDFWKWSRQAMGFKGFLFGWTVYFQNKVSKAARERLLQYINAHS
jgi:hypothetical protein